jgi:hypothetical protein
MAAEMEATVAKLRKSASAEVWISLREYQGKQYVDIREHFLLADDRQWHPTKKGIMLHEQLLPEVIDGVEALAAASDLGVVATIAKSKRDEVRIAVREYERRRYGEVRSWYADQDERKPGKGVTFRLELVDSLVEALRAAEDQLASGDA